MPIFPSILDYVIFVKLFKKNESFSVNEDIKEVNSIINTPLYKIYVENDNFDTLNMIKPIKIKQIKRKTTFQINLE